MKKVCRFFLRAWVIWLIVVPKITMKKTSIHILDISIQYKRPFMLIGLPESLDYADDTEFVSLVRKYLDKLI